MKNLHLIFASIIIITVGLIYGYNPTKVLPFFFGFKVENLELKNIFRATMGLYLGFAFYWLYAIKNQKYWKSATVTLIIFMTGLALGRLVSAIIDGLSYQYTLGLIVELLLMMFGVYNLKKYREE